MYRAYELETPGAAYIDDALITCWHCGDEYRVSPDEVESELAKHHGKATVS